MSIRSSWSISAVSRAADAEAALAEISSAAAVCRGQGVAFCRTMRDMASVIRAHERSYM